MEQIHSASLREGKTKQPIVVNKLLEASFEASIEVEAERAVQTYLGTTETYFFVDERKVFSGPEL